MCPFSRKTKVSGVRGDGFTLVEVVLALGLFAFGIVAMIGLMPLALQTHLDAKVDTILAQIHQRLAAEAISTDFSKLDQLNGQLRSFDAEGGEVFGAASTKRPIIFSAKTVITTASLPPAYLPGAMKKVVFYAIHDPAARGVPPSVKPTSAILIANTAPVP